MKTFSQTTSRTAHWSIDCHVHLFDEVSMLKNIPEKCICFADIDLNKPILYQNIYQLYNKYWDKIPKGCTMLSTGMTINDIKQVYFDHPRDIKGFGELKLYDRLNGQPVNYKSCDLVKEVLEFSHSVGDLPVYIHFMLEDSKDVDDVTGFALNFPSVPIVLCHSGINNQSDAGYSWAQAVALANKHNNIWLEISWSSLLYIHDYPFLLDQVPKDRIIMGSDRSPFGDRSLHPTNTHEDIQKKIHDLCEWRDWDGNLKRLFPSV